MKAEHIPANQMEGLAAVGESVGYDVQSANTGNVDVTLATMTMSNSNGRWKDRRFTPKGRWNANAAFFVSTSSQ